MKKRVRKASVDILSILKNDLSCQEEGRLMAALPSVIGYFKFTDAALAVRYAKEVCEAVVENCLTTGKNALVKQAQCILKLVIEVGGIEVFLDSMEKVIRNNVAEGAVPAIDVTRQALSEF